MLIYPDACILIYLIEEHPVIHLAIREKLRQGKQTRRFLFSELLRLECCLGPMKQGDSLRLARFDRFFANPSHQWITASRAVFERATQLRAEHGLKTPDALHLAAALEAGCDEFWTNDHRLETAAAGRIRVTAFN